MLTSFYHDDVKLWNFLFYGRRTPLKCTSRKIRNILQIEQDGVKVIKYKTALILILRYILAAIVTCDQAIFFFFWRGVRRFFFFFGGGKFPPAQKKKKSPDRRLLPSLPWLPIKFPIINSGIGVHGDRTDRSRIMSAFA